MNPLTDGMDSTNKRKYMLLEDGELSIGIFRSGGGGYVQNFTGGNAGDRHLDHATVGLEALQQ